jgi:type VI secretion system Hcp family effector
MNIFRVTGVFLFLCFGSLLYSETYFLRVPAYSDGSSSIKDFEDWFEVYSYELEINTAINASAGTVVGATIQSPFSVIVKSGRGTAAILNAAMNKDMIVEITLKVMSDDRSQEIASIKLQNSTLCGYRRFNGTKYQVEQGIAGPHSTELKFVYRKMTIEESNAQGTFTVKTSARSVSRIDGSRNSWGN